MERNYKHVLVTKKGEKWLKDSSWLYESDIDKYDPFIEDGELVDVLSSKAKYIGTGFYNSKSKIRVRLLSRNTNDIFDYDFYKRRVSYAYNYRKMVMNDLSNFRVIYGESDYLPGVTVDKYNDILVTEILSLGMDKNKEHLYKALIEVFKEDNIEIKAIYERNESVLRDKEGLPKYKGFYLGSGDTNTIIIENGIKYYVDFENGHKTGFFLDQKYNRLLVRDIAKDKVVLDTCTHTGSFAMNAYMGGAKKVTALDISSKALEDAKHNFELNNMDIDTIEGDVFEVLKNTPKGLYDMIILDPPAFTKSKDKVGNALKGYKELNYLGMKALKRGGILVSASCTHFVTKEMLEEVIYEASKDANVNLKLVSFTGPSRDHPELLGMKETNYLKFFIFQVN